MKVLVAIHGPVRAWTIANEAVERLRCRFPHITFAHATDPETARREIAEAEVAFASDLRPAQLEAARRLRWIHSPAAGVGHMLFPALVNSDVPLTNSRGLHATTMAEHVIAVTLMLRRNLPLALARQRAHLWAQDEFVGPGAIRLFRGSQVAVVGLGAVGSAIAAAASALGARVIGIRRAAARTNPPPGVEQVYGRDGLADALGLADVVVLAAPLTRETHGLIGSPELRRMKPEGILVNVGRGQLVKERELAHELAAGTIAGAALDVFEDEPLDPASPLWELSNVVITPHVAGIRDDYWTAAVDLFGENLSRYEHKEPLLNLVDKRAGY